jgi:hypothetical protein
MMVLSWRWLGSSLGVVVSRQQEPLAGLLADTMCPAVTYHSSQLPHGSSVPASMHRLSSGWWYRLAVFQYHTPVPAGFDDPPPERLTRTSLTTAAAAQPKAPGRLAEAAAKAATAAGAGAESSAPSSSSASPARPMSGSSAAPRRPAARPVAEDSDDDISPMDASPVVGVPQSRRFI